MILQEISEQQNISIQNIYYMLAYAFNAPVKDDLEYLATEKFDNVYNLFAGLLSVYIGRLLKQGLYREYLDTRDDLPMLRGKINMPGTIKHQTANRILLSCEYDELSENILLNRILKTTSMLIIADSRFNGEYRDMLKKTMLYFSNVGTIPYASIPWGSIRFHQNNQAYSFLINICQLLINELLPSYGKKGPRRLELINDSLTLAKLYEKFVLAYYKKKFEDIKGGIKVRSNQIKWKVEPKEDTRLPKMQSDITLTYGGKVLIIDTKYYTHNTYSKARIYDDDDEPDNKDYKIHPQNLYQIFTYVKNKAAEYKLDKRKGVSGMLLYARTDDPITRQPDTHFNLDGNEIYIQTLNLNCPFSETKAQLDQIVEKHFKEYFNKNNA